MITPNTFSLENAMDIVPDARRRVLASEARKFAEGGFPARRLWRKAETLWGYVYYEHERIVWMDAYYKRKARIARIKERA